MNITLPLPNLGEKKKDKGREPNKLSVNDILSLCCHDTETVCLGGLFVLHSAEGWWSSHLVPFSAAHTPQLLVVTEDPASGSLVRVITPSVYSMQ